MSARARSIAAILMVSGATLLSAAPASADHHFMSIREVYPGTTVGDDDEFVELQMYAAGQNDLFDMTPGQQPRLRVYDANGTIVQTITPGSDPPNAQNQQSILFATDDAETAFTVPEDFLMAPEDDIQSDGGAVCFHSDAFGNIDCVAWGMFDNTAMQPGLPLPVGNNETGPIPLGSSITRSITANCLTALDGADDTNDSQADFSDTATPTPRNNADGIITETVCTPPGGGGGGTGTAPGNPISPINPAGNVRKRKCKKSNRAAAAKKKKCKKKK